MTNQSQPPENQAAAREQGLPDERLLDIQYARDQGVLPWSHLSNPQQQAAMAGKVIDYLLSLLQQPATSERAMTEIRERQEQRRRFRQARPNPRWPDPEPDIDYLVSRLADNGLAYKEALQTAQYLAAAHFPHVPEWEPLPTLRGVLSQIDNMVMAWAAPATSERCVGCGRELTQPKI